MEVQKIDGVYDSNTFVVKDGGKCFIVDSGAECDKVADAVKDDKVLGVFVTHGHFDHIMHACEMAKRYNCKIYASDKVVDTASSPAKNYGENFAVHDFSDFVFLSGDGEIEPLGVKYFATPGHSPCCVSFLIGDQLFAGDTLFSSGIGWIDLIGSNRQQMIASLEKLQGIEFETCHSGHGLSSTYARQERNLKAFHRYLTR